MLGFAEFPTVCLDRIFDHLPLSDLLYTVPQVCRQWRELHPFACHRRALSLRPLRLTYSHPLPRAVLQNQRILEQFYAGDGLKGRTNEDFDRYLNQDRQDLVEMQGLEWKPENIEYCDRLVSLLPGLTGLVWKYQITGTTSLTNHIDHFTVLLQSWSHSLKSLEIQLDGEDMNQYYHGQEATSWIRLFEAINSLACLGSLTLKIMSNLDRHGISCPQLSILSRLEHFTFDGKGLMYYNDDEAEWLEIWIVSLSEYALTNRSLQTITIGPDSRVSFAHPNQPNYVMNLDPCVCVRFVELHLDDFIYSDQLQSLPQEANNLNIFASFCRQFSSLTCLSIGVAMCTMRELMDALVHLRQLERLNLILDGDQADQLHDDDRDAPLPPPMPSVRILKLRIDSLNRHTDIEPFRFESLFPGLQVVDFWNNQQECTTCDVDEWMRMSNKTLARFARCDRLSRQSFKHCTELKRLYYFNSLSVQFDDYDSDEIVEFSDVKQRKRWEWKETCEESVNAELGIDEHEEIMRFKTIHNKKFFTRDEL